MVVAAMVMVEEVPLPLEPQQLVVVAATVVEEAPLPQRLQRQQTMLLLLPAQQAQEVHTVVQHILACMQIAASSICSMPVVLQQLLVELAKM